MYLVDSSTIVSFFRKGEAAYDESQILLKSLEKFFITDYILAEVLTVLRLRESQSVVKRCLELLELNEGVGRLRLTHAEFDLTLDYFLENKGISFVDASLVVMAHERGLALITQDKQLLKMFKHYKGPGKVF